MQAVGGTLGIRGGHGKWCNQLGQRFGKRTHSCKSEMLHLCLDAPPLPTPFGLFGKEGVPERQGGQGSCVRQGN